MHINMSGHGGRVTLDDKDEFKLRSTGGDNSTQELSIVSTQWGNSSTVLIRGTMEQFVEMSRKVLYAVDCDRMEKYNGFRI